MALVIQKIKITIQLNNSDRMLPTGSLAIFIKVGACEHKNNFNTPACYSQYSAWR